MRGNNWSRWLLLMCLWAGAGYGQTAIEVRQFSSPQQQALYEGLLTELRCLVCQNENLADSNAELAGDLRNEVYAMVTQQGLDEQAVKTFLVQRYGNFVLYRPPVQASTWLLWGGPFVMLLVGGVALWRVARQGRAVGPVEDDLSQRLAARRLLEDEE
ncbi:cytochrome c-type biogenesis protein [Candidatus Thiothrix sp. Deng01]|uniref:Cytochrome c-type biogenesis protein n=1 Tax=Candidatus Thiothrix phosphatis TaxID=3112415 RepID=A0ABU6D2P4_9GAMM|nr:cytochrome c-type biogenesis protein [Candidatus Thiothrix sp. Deng01]MEB4593339.1 cytochrome c-type biogenesis protein [Candidatus Thiothrix sp. Deng01]